MRHHDQHISKAMPVRAALTNAFVVHASRPDDRAAFGFNKPHKECGWVLARVVGLKSRSFLSAFSVLIVGLALTCVPALSAAPFEKCVGKNPCTACKNCASCAHCAIRVNGKLVRGKAFLNRRQHFCGRCEPICIVQK